MASTQPPSPAPPAFRIHLTCYTPPPPTRAHTPAAARCTPPHLFARLPAHKDDDDDDGRTYADAALAHRIRKEPVSVDLRFGAITLDWADNETVLARAAEDAAMHPAAPTNARLRPPHARTGHPRQGHGQGQTQAQTQAQRDPGATPPRLARGGPRAPAADHPATPTRSSIHSHEHPAGTSALGELPVPVARYTQQSTFDADPEPPPPDRSAAVTVEAAASTYSIGRTHVAFGIVHLFRDQSEASAAERDTHFPSLSGASHHHHDYGTRTANAPQPPPPPPPSAVQVTSDDEAGSILGILAVPAHMTAADFLAFIEPAADAISHIRMLREAQTEKCMVLIKFRDPADAEEFHKMYEGAPFSDVNLDELCQVVYITHVTVSASYTLPHAYPLLANSDPWPMLPHPTTAAVVPPTTATAAAATAAGGAPPGAERLAAQLTYELPTCPVCLERMDSDITGLMTVTCQHTFHCSCLSKWIDSRCPVCRYSQTRQQGGAVGSVAAHSRCTICLTSSDLWVCLICASVGCGRYKAGHARQHFEETGHLYSLELETQRVWDYAGDGYVHRLIQNKADGKLVELPPASSTVSTPVRNPRKQQHASGTGPGDTSLSPAGGKGVGGSSRATAAAAGGSSHGAEVEDKVEALGLEYSNLIVSQLESQRSFYEEQVRLAQSQLEASSSAQSALREQLADAERTLDGLRQRIADAERAHAALASERARADKRTEKALELMRKHERELHTERAQTGGLLANVDKMRAERDDLRRELAEVRAELAGVREELRDLMFFVSARDQIEAGGGGGELAGADIVGVPETGPSSGSKSNKKKKKKAAPSAAVVAQLAAAQQSQRQQQQQQQQQSQQGGDEPTQGNQDTS